MNDARHTPDENTTVLNTKDRTAGQKAAETKELLNQRERLLEKARKYNLLSDVFMSVALEDKQACQHVLRILTDRPDLVVKEVRSKYRISKIVSHDAELDIFAEDSSGKLFNIEIQRRDTVDHARRTRFYGSMVDSECLQKGKTYAELPEVYIIYISETDLWKAGRTAYPVRKYFDGTDISYEDGLHILYVNAAVDDDSPKARLMRYFKTASPDDMSQGELSKRVRLLKSEEGEKNAMDSVSEEIYTMGKNDGLEEGRMEGHASGRAEGLAEGRMESLSGSVRNMHRKGCSDEQIAELLDVDVEMVRKWIAEELMTAK